MSNPDDQSNTVEERSAGWVYTNTTDGSNFSYTSDALLATVTQSCSATLEF